MSDIMQVDEVLALLRPMFREMLHQTEFASLRLELVSTDDPEGTALDDEDLIEQNSAHVRWRILKERGWSGTLWVDEGPVALVRSVQSDLQDFIAESRFGWDELRGPRDLP